MQAALRCAADEMVNDPLYFEETSDQYRTLAIRSGSDPERIAGCKAYGALCFLLMVRTGQPPANVSPFLFVASGGSRDLYNAGVVSQLVSKSTMTVLQPLFDLKTSDSLNSVSPLLAHYLNQQVSDDQLI